MASFPAMTVTNAGNLLLTKGLSGKTIQFTKIVLGDGQLNGVSISTLTALISQKAYCGVTRKTVTNSTYQVGGLLLPANITSGFYWREVGLVAVDPDNRSEVLYAYANAGSATDYIDPNATDSRFEKNIYVNTKISSASTVTITIPSSDTYVLKSEAGITYEPPLKDATSKDTPTDADRIPMVDSADSNKTKTLLWSKIKSLFAAASHAATHHTGGSDPLAPVDIGAAITPTSVTVTLPVSGWTLNSSTTCYEQTVPVTGLLASDNTATVTAWPHGSTDAAAQLLTDAAYAAIFTQGGYAACNQDGHLYCRGPAGGSKPQVDFPVDVIIHR